MPGYALWVPFVFGAMVLAYTLIHRSTSARRRPVVDALIVRLEVPVDDDIIALIDRRVRNDVIASCLGGFVALVVLAGLVALNGGFAEGLSSTVLGLAFVAAISLGSAAAGVWQFAPQSTRGVRIARVKTPHLDDYLHPLWLWSSIGVCVLAVLCCVAILFGVGPSADGSLAGVPLAAVYASTGVAVMGQFAAVVLGRRILAVPQPARNETELRWDDALRGMALRSLWIAALTLGWAAALLAGLWLLAPAPDVTVWFGFVAVVPILLFSLPASRRTEWYLWPDASAPASAEPAVLGAP